MKKFPRRNRWRLAVLMGLCVLAGGVVFNYLAHMHGVPLGGNLVWAAAGLGLFAMATGPGGQTLGDDPTYGPPIYLKQDGFELHVRSTGAVTFDNGAEFDPTQSVAATVVAPGITPGGDCKIRVTGPAATGNVVIPNNTGYTWHIVDAVFVKSAVAGGAGDVVAVSSPAGSIFGNLSLNVAGAAIVRPTSLTAANQEVAPGTNLTIAFTKVTDVTGELMLDVIRSA